LFDVPTEMFAIWSETRLFCLNFNVFCQVLLPILEIPLYSDAGRSHLHSAFSEIISFC